jgi:UDP-N-acetylmuramyl pentapeptide phosphotransferase/UDP-N-acetylglucosamine-1-phosphate transferase
MEHSVLDLPALFLTIVIAVVVAGVTIAAHDDANARRGWLAALALAIVLIALGVIDLVREQPRETHLATVVLGAALPIIGAIGTMRGTKRVSRRWIRWPLIFLAAFLLLYVGALLGAALVPRVLPF